MASKRKSSLDNENAKRKRPNDTLSFQDAMDDILHFVEYGDEDIESSDNLEELYNDDVEENFQLRNG